MAEVAEPVGVNTNSQFPVRAGLEDVPHAPSNVKRISKTSLFRIFAFVAVIVIMIRSPS